MEDIAMEVRMLEFKLQILQRTYGTSLLPVNQARVLQAECELREKSLISCWNSYGIPLEAAISQLRGQVRGLLNETEIPTGYKAWAQVHFDIHDQLRVNTSNLCFRCSEKSCIHYIYGFSTIDELRKHFGERHRPISSAPPIINQEDRLLQNQTPITCQDILNDSDLNADFVYVSFDSSSVQKRKAQKQPAGRRKDKRRSGDEVTKTGRQKDPCLRCKVLKKECDDETPCKQCPQQGINEKGDYWKVLGCLRGRSGSLVKTFLPESLFQSLGLSIDADSAVNISSVWYHILNQGTPPLTKTQDFVTFAKGFEYLRSIDSFNGFLGNLCRPGYTYDKIVWMKWLPEVWALFKVRKANEADAKAPALDICTLYQNSTLVLDTMFEIEMVGLAILLLEHKSSPPKQGGRSGSSNTGTTTVRRTPNTMCDACRMWKSRCFIHTGQKACVLCQFRSRLCSFVHNPEPKQRTSNGNDKESLATVNSNGNDDVMRDALYYLSKSLESFLNTAFSKSCCRRKCLSPKDWFQMFAGLCSCSILKSLLIDAQVGIGLSDNGTQANIAARIDSAYKALVSIFAWAAKFDLLVEWYRTTGAEDPLRNSTESEKESFETLCRLVQRDEWENRGIKSSKDFLMGLGSGFYNDGTYNGFYIQRYGLKQPRKSKDESPSRGNEDGAQYSGNSLHQSAPRPPHLRETGHLDERIEAISEQPNDNTAQDSSETHQQLIAEDSTLPNVVPMVDPIQRHRSHNDVNHTWYEPLLY